MHRGGHLGAGGDQQQVQKGEVAVDANLAVMDTRFYTRFLTEESTSGGYLIRSSSELMPTRTAWGIPVVMATTALSYGTLTTTRGRWWATSPTTASAPMLRAVQFPRARSARHRGPPVDVPFPVLVAGHLYLSARRWLFAS